MSCALLLLLMSLALAMGTGAAVEVQRPRGVPLSKRQFYEENKPFTCLDGSSTIPFDRVNDDYCDCRDGSDEPGTAACPNGSFHCTNAGFRPAFIPSSRINDGICDCCDTTDEYNSGATCQNTCREMGRKERESLQIMAEITKEGFMLKQQLIHEAKRGQEDKRGKLTELQGSKKGLEGKVEALRTVKETAENPEKEAKERHLKSWEEQKELIRMEKDKTRMAEAFLELDDDADGYVSVAELQSHLELDPDSDGSLTETETQGLLGGADKVDTSTFQTVWSGIKDKYLHFPILVEWSVLEPQIGYLGWVSGQHFVGNGLYKCVRSGLCDCGEFATRQPQCLISAGFGNNCMLVLATLKYLMMILDMQTLHRHTRAGCIIRFENTNECTLCLQVNHLICHPEFIWICRNLEKEIGFDFGPSAEFAYLYSQCYELSTSEYIYRLCPFNRVSQKPKFGGSETNLGLWGQWAGPEDNLYSVMKYDHGQGCWQGPNRSTTVKLTCGKETVVTSTSEPSRCEYLMEFTTPAVCQEPASLDEVLDEVLHEHTEL
uniref:Glucosidase 2 subunit beta n=1 Tax=Salmo trutta TaxID=8032 RepID=A0A673YR15_SALTR